MFDPMLKLNIFTPIPAILGFWCHILHLFILCKSVIVTIVIFVTLSFNFHATFMLWAYLGVKIRPPPCCVLFKRTTPSLLFDLQLCFQENYHCIPCIPFLLSHDWEIYTKCNVQLIRISNNLSGTCTIITIGIMYKHKN